MPPNIRDTPFAISVTLTPNRASDKVRTISLKPGEPVTIGRASKSAFKNLEVRQDNALFDCPVVSREHAELRTHMWDLVENQVTITDKGSMHGTRVNGVKLREGQPKTLRPGDHILFGEQVTRGEDTHNGVFVTFNLTKRYLQESNTFAANSSATNPTGVYRYPYTSDEESDYESDGDVSIIGGADEVHSSSAKTTPEHGKAKLGTQESPIDLDQPDKPKRTLVQDSLDAQDSILVPESLPVARRAQPAPVNIDSDAGADAPKPFLWPKTWNPDPARSSSHISDEDDQSEVDDVEYADGRDVQHESDLSDSDASELNRYTPLDGSEDEDDEEVECRMPPPPAPREPSPELLSSGQSAPIESSTLAPGSTLRPLGPAFSSPAEPFGSRHETLPAPRASVSQQTPVNSYGYDAASVNSTSNLGPRSYPSQYAAGGSSRWDKPPTYPAQEQASSLAGSYGLGSNPYISPLLPYDLSTSYASGPPPAFGYTFPSASAFDNNYPPRSPKLNSAPTTSESRTSIPYIVGHETEKVPEPAHVDVTNDVLSAHYAPHAEVDKDFWDQTRVMIEKFAGATPSTATKRKLEDLAEMGSSAPVSAAELQDDGSITAAHIDEGAAQDEIEQLAPAPKKAKTESTIAAVNAEQSAAPPHTPASTSSTVATVAKYTAVASAGAVGGAVGLFGFLCSPAADRLMDWVSSF